MHLYPSEEPLLATHTPCSPQSASEFSVLQIDVFCVQWRPNHPGKQSHLISESVLCTDVLCIREITPQRSFAKLSRIIQKNFRIIYT